MRRLERLLVSRGLLILCGLGFIVAATVDRPRTMESRPGEVHGLRGSPRDAHTRIVLESLAAGNTTRRTAQQAIEVQAPAQAAFNITDWEGQELPANARAALGYAVNIWSRLINSPVTIQLQARWASTSGFLASGTASIHRDFPNAPIPNVWYPKPLADAFAGADIQPSAGGIQITFNSSVNWY